jgi:rhodanese-related sulfurtransferase
MDIGIFMAATQRAASPSAYAGDVTPKEAWQALGQQPQAQLIDVRTHAEWVYAGIPQLRDIDKEARLVSLRLYPELDLNPDFLAQLEKTAPDKSAPLYFLCRGGVRSVEAAKMASAAGWQHCYNILYGYEGQANERQQRGKLDGWKASELPWQHP